MRLFLWIFLGRAVAADLQVMYFNTDGTEHRTMAAAANTVAEILRGLGISLSWNESPAEAELLVSYVQPEKGAKGREQKCRALRSIHLRILRAGPPGVSKFILGYSNPLAPEGINVTIFGDAVESASIRYQASMSVILGHAIAHEIGHVLLRSGTHSAGGLMSASWTSREYFWMKSRLLRFSRKDAESIRLALAGVECGSGSGDRSRAVLTRRVAIP